MDNKENSISPKYLTVEKAAAYYDWKIGGLRWAIFHAKANGLDRALRRVGRKILIDKIEFEAWIDSQKGAR